jgi:hypothetical protein
MIAASIFDHPAILILIALVTLIRWLLEKAKTSSQKTESPPPTPDTPVPRGSETQTEEERIRRFMEALGQKPGSTPPPKVTARRRAMPPTVFPRLPQLKTVPPVLPKRPAAPPPLPVEIPTIVAAKISASDFQVHDVPRQTSSEPAPEASRKAARYAGQIKLGTPQDLRTAIVLREIFGPPRSLQGFDLTGGL